jgi:RNA polymerase sigma-70 factor (ECF subfamily)
MTAVTLAPAWVDDDLGYSEFYARYHRALTSYLRMGFRDADVEAVAQETFCRALAHWNVVGNMTSPWPWLAVTARNLARNNIRDERASRAAGLEVFPDTTCSADDVAEQVEASESLRRLAQAMTVLTPLQKRLLTVMVEEGLTGAQLARRLDMRPGAVRMHLCRLRLRLGEQFAALGGALALTPAALLGVLRRFRAAKAAGQIPVTLSAAVAAVGLAVVGLVPSVPFLADGQAASPQVSSVAQVATSAVSAVRRPTAPAHATRPTKPAVTTSSATHGVAEVHEVNIAGELRTSRVSIDKRGGQETPQELAARCLQHLTVNAHYVGCEANGNGTQTNPPE